MKYTSEVLQRPTDVNGMARELLAAARTVCHLRERLERRGHQVNLDFDWENGMTAQLELVHCWSPRLTVNGIEVQAAE